MNAPTKMLAFAALLGLVFAGAALAGAAVGPEPDRSDAGDAHGGDAGGHASEAVADPVRGLASAEDGLRLTIAEPELRRGRRELLRFAIVDEHGETVRDFDVEHEKRMHLIVVRRDLTGFQHLHPEQSADGAWTTSVRLPEAGSYRVLADFTRDGEPHTLAGDLRVDGAADLRALPDPAPTATTDGGYEVRLEGGDVRAGEPAELRFGITRDGEPVQVEPYLGAGGHLVALREGDLAFLHVHPLDDGDAAFEATFPSAGRYRLFLQFQHEGRVRTVAFTQEVAQ